MGFLIVSSLAIGSLFAFERFYLKRRFGIFALLFWVFVTQLLLLAGSWAVSRSGVEFDGLLAQLGAALAGIAFLTLGITPLAAVSIALFLGLIWTFQHLSAISKATK